MIRIAQLLFISAGVLAAIVFAGAMLDSIQTGAGDALADSVMLNIRGGCSACSTKISPPPEMRIHYECGHNFMGDVCDPTRCITLTEQGDFCSDDGLPAFNTTCQTKDVFGLPWMSTGTLKTYNTNACPENGPEQVWARWGWGGCNGSICSGHDIKVQCLRSSACPSGEIKTEPGHGSGGIKQRYCT